MHKLMPAFLCYVEYKGETEETCENKGEMRKKDKCECGFLLVLVVGQYNAGY